MKNLSVILFATTMSLGLAACSKSTSESSSNAETSPNSIITYTASEKLPEINEVYQDDPECYWQFYGLHVKAFNVAIKTHSFSDGKGTIIFDGDVTSIGDYAFSSCRSLTSVSLPTSVTSIGFASFSWCTSLTFITLPNSVTSIGDWAFNSCFSLSSITIPDGVLHIGEGTFWDCGFPTSITIPNSVTDIGDGAFQYVYNVAYSGTATGSPWGARCVNGYIEGNLAYLDASKTILCGCSSAASGEIILPNSVTSIRSFVFLHCTSLKSVTLPNSVDCIEKGAFHTGFSNLIVRVPQESYDRFRRMIDSDVTVVGY